MEIKDIPPLYCSSAPLLSLTARLRSAAVRCVSVAGVPDGALPVVVAAQQCVVPSPVVVIADDDEAAAYLYDDLRHLLGDDAVVLFPSAYKRAARYGQKDDGMVILRTGVLARLAAPTSNPLTIVTSPAALAEKVAPQGVVQSSSITLSVGQALPLSSLTSALSEQGFVRVDYVYTPGQYAVRGSIVDVFSYAAPQPYRLDFFGDTLDSLRSFAVDTQLSEERVDSVTLLPALDSATTSRTSLLALLPEDSVVYCRDPLFVRDTIAAIYAAGISEQAIAESVAACPSDEENIRRQMSSAVLFCSGDEYMAAWGRLRQVVVARGASTEAETIAFAFSPPLLFHKNIPLLRATLGDYHARGYTTFLLADSDKQHARLRSLLSSSDDPTPLPTAVQGVLHEGFVDDDNKYFFCTDHQIFDRYHRHSSGSAPVRRGQATLTMKEVHSLHVGDYLVHIDFGIGRFGGLVRKTLPAGDGQKNSYKEEIRIIYQRGDIVDLSLHALHKISKYRGGDGTAPRLSTLGTGAWERMKERTKSRIKEVARDLIRLYAQRQHVKGFTFSADTYLQQSLEASFIYEDTPDQLRATQQVKRDMEAPQPMDRLICGDVGFGKTEVAIRAAFKAAADDKQVAVLVPTTVLAYQHFATFSARLKEYPVRVEYLSRARSTKDVKEILTAVEKGEVDILIGTHKLLSPTVHWHDLGLLIIDEEQKFGVAAKEQLRQKRANIDTLTLTATPIPRTLQFSLMGARDMSVMRTPPPNRYPITTTIATTDDKKTLVDAINYEMSRSGQVFIVNDRIAGLPALAESIRRAIPDCRLAVAHGGLRAEEVEKILIAFINYEYDVLLSTTIMENGVDIPNANTIIINDAHHFGLADLHQMRGRVGRSNRKAFCYLLAPPLAVLPDDARRRLQALETYADLGAGLSLAMQDLDIRGAGNILGREQSGFIADVGYETYQKILTQALAELYNDEGAALYGDKGEKEEKDTTAERYVDDCTVESDLAMFFPDDYVPTVEERILLYRELDNLTSDDEMEAFRRRLVDRFGAIPHEGEELINVVLLRRYGRQGGCEKITLRQGLMILQFVANPSSPYYHSDTFGRVLDYIGHNARRCQLKEVAGRRLLHIRGVHSVEEALAALRALVGKEG